MASSPVQTFVGDELVAFLYADATGHSRGRAVPAAGVERRLERGVGWVPADPGDHRVRDACRPQPAGVARRRASPSRPGDGDPAALTECERELAVGVLPRSLEEALAAFENTLVRGEVWDNLRKGYCTLKREEIELLSRLETAEVCARYVAVF